MLVARETAKYDSIIVLVKSASRGEQSRHRLFDSSLVGEKREAAVRDAFVGACDELWLALKRWF